MQRTITIKESDLSGADNASAYRLGLGSKDYELDLTPKEVSELEKALARYLKVARPAGKQTRASNGRAGTYKVKSRAKKATKKTAAKSSKPAGSRAKASISPTEIREWARQSGITVNERGRISAQLVEQFEAATGGKAAKRTAKKAAKKSPGRKPAAKKAPTKAKGSVNPVEVREWARQNGITVNERGRISAQLVEQFEAATGGKAAKRTARKAAGRKVAAKKSPAKKTAKRAGRGAAAKKSPAKRTSFVSPIEVRTWARQNNVEVSERGRIPAKIIEQFQSAKGNEPAATEQPAPVASNAPTLAPTFSKSGNGNDMASPTEIREWARQNKMEINERGRIPSEIVEQYQAAN